MQIVHFLCDMNMTGLAAQSYSSCIYIKHCHTMRTCTIGNEEKYGTEQHHLFRTLHPAKLPP